MAHREPRRSYDGGGSTDADRPDPDAVLSQIRAEDEKKGRLRIFFGYAAGVGKTYAMLQASRQLAAEGKDVLVGYLEAHGRVETEVLVEGLEALPRATGLYRGVQLADFDLDAALARKPGFLILDELAHANAPWCRHRSRFQDALELLDAGIDVFTTLNVQHIESLNDVVAGITGIAVSETVPDFVFDAAAAIDLVDLPPEDLMERFREGKVYVPEQAARATVNFFKRENLLALREIALRRTAERVSLDVESTRRAVASDRIWRTHELLLVAVSASETSGTLIRRARRMAAAFAAPWIACSVDTGELRRPGDRERLARHLALAERLGAEVRTLQGLSPAEAILDYALRRNVTRIVIGKNEDRGVRRYFRRGLAEQIIRGSRDIDVYVIRGTRDESATLRERVPAHDRVSVSSVGLTLAAIASATGIAELFGLLHVSETNIIMAYVLEVFVVALFLGWLPSVAASVLSVLAFNFFFTAPRYTFDVDNAEYIVTFAVMLAVSLVTSGLVQRVRRQTVLTAERQQRAETLARLSRSLAGAGGQASVLVSAERALTELLTARVQIVRRDQPAPLDVDAAAVTWVMAHGEPAGAGTNTLPGLGSLYLPLPGTDTTRGVLVIAAEGRNTVFVGEQRQLLEAVTSIVALAIEREELADRARTILLEAQQERAHNALLRAISHDLRTPLASIAGAASALRGGGIDAETEQRLVEGIDEEAGWLSSLVENLLQLSRLDGPESVLHRSTETVDDLVSAAVTHSGRSNLRRRLHVALPEEVVTVRVDPTLIEQVLINLLDNAVKYSAADTPIELTVKSDGVTVGFTVSDRGTGIARPDLPHIFERFFRGAGAKSRGIGLGLAICRAAVEAHGGEIGAGNREGGGAAFWFTLPVQGGDRGRSAGADGPRADSGDLGD